MAFLDLIYCRACIQGALHHSPLSHDNHLIILTHPSADLSVHAAARCWSRPAGIDGFFAVVCYISQHILSVAFTAIFFLAILSCLHANRGLLMFSLLSSAQYDKIFSILQYTSSNHQFMTSFDLIVLTNVFKYQDNICISQKLSSLFVSAEMV